MKKIFFAFAILLSNGLFAQSKGRVIIKGTMEGDLKGHNKIQLFTRTDKDSTEIKNGQYTFSFPFESPTMKMVYPEYTQKMGRMYRPFGILISEPGIYYISSNVEDMYKTSIIKGSKSAEIYRTFEKDQDKTLGMITNEVIKLYGNEWYRIDENNPLYSSYQKSRDSLNKIYLEPLIENLIKKNSNQYVSAFVLNGAGKQINSIETMEHLFALLSPKMQQSVSGKSYNDYIQGLKNSKIGNSVANFILPAPDGKDVDFKNFTGKYVLIDFWASWCAPCRQSFPHMREVYQKYKGDTFEIYSISIDEDKSSWLKAVEEEKNPWPQSLDTKNISKSSFAVTAVPTTYLIDPSGKIIMKEIGFDTSGNSKIEKKIKEISKSKPSGDKKMIPAIKMY